jgi:protease-4
MNFIKKLFSPIVFIQNNFKAVVFIFIVYLVIAPQSKEDFISNNLQEIKLTGPIMEVSEVLQKIQTASKNDDIKGVLLVVDSPGGAVSPSVEIAYAIKRLKEKKPVIVYASGTIASGSYYASIWANEIIANPGSMVGSIGVIMQGTNLSEIMQKIGIKTQTVQAGKYKQIGTSNREWTTYEKDELDKVIQGTYNMFTKDVSDARGLDINNRDVYADAHIFTASQAQAVGLVDSIGVSFDAKARLIELSGVKEAIWNEEDKFDKFMKKFSATTAITLHTYFPELVLK